MSEAALLLAGVLLGGIATYLASNFLAIVSEDVALINDLVTDLKELEVLGVRYWSLPKGDSRAFILESRITSLQHAIGSYEPHAKRLLRSDFKLYRSLSVDLIICMTGGTFGTTAREPDQLVINEMLTVGLDLRLLLRLSRRKKYWAH